MRFVNYAVGYNRQLCHLKKSFFQFFYRWYLLCNINLSQINQLNSKTDSEEKSEEKIKNIGALFIICCNFNKLLNSALHYEGAGKFWGPFNGKLTSPRGIWLARGFIKVSAFNLIYRVKYNQESRF